MSGYASHHAVITIAVAAVIVALAGCLPGPYVPPGSRQLVITVSNESLAPAILEVAPMGLGGSNQPIGRGGGSAWRSPRRCHQVRSR
jgi:hypothetical protein